MGDSDVNGLRYERRVEKLKFSLYTTDEEIHNCVDTEAFSWASSVLIQDYVMTYGSSSGFKEFT